MMCHRIGRPPISTMGLGRIWDSSDIRVPSPPARITAFIWTPRAEVHGPKRTPTSLSPRHLSLGKAAGKDQGVWRLIAKTLTDGTTRSKTHSANVPQGRIRVVPEGIKRVLPGWGGFSFNKKPWKGSVSVRDRLQHPGWKKLKIALPKNRNVVLLAILRPRQPPKVLAHGLG